MSVVSVLIVNYNGRKWLEGCFRSLAEQTHPDVEVVMVDNCSTDDSVAFVRESFPWVKLHENTWNAGFAGGNNFGLQFTSGEYVVLLNTDTRVTPTFITDLLKAFEENPQRGCVQPKLIFLHDPSLLDSCGSYFAWNGFLKHIGNMQRADTPEYNQAFPVLTVKGACMMFRRSLLEQVGGLFDDSYWCYFEETDFCMRVWMAGYECWYWPKSAIYHAMGGTGGVLFKDASQYHSAKNRLTTYLAAFEWGTLARMLPPYLTINVGLILFFLVIGQWNNSRAMARALWTNVRSWRYIREKRRHIQAGIRKRRDRDFLPNVTRPISLIGMATQLWYLITYERHRW